MKAYWSSLALAIGLAVPAITGAAGAMAQEAPTIIVVSHGQANDPFWSVVKNGVDYAAKETGAKVSYRAPETFDMVAMGQLIDAAVNQAARRARRLNSRCGRPRAVDPAGGRGRHSRSSR